MKKTRPAKSSLSVAKLLDSEGYSDHTANQIRRYWHKNCVLTERQEKRAAGIHKAFSDHVASKLTESQRLVMGKYIALLNRANFETGLRMGLTVRLFPGEEEMSVETAGSVGKGMIQAKNDEISELKKDLKTLRETVDWNRERFSALVEFYERAIARDKHHSDLRNKPLEATCICVWCEDYREAIKKVEAK